MKMTATQRRKVRREAILDAAEQVIAERGFHNTGIADIASHLGMGHGTFYRYFKNKADIANHVLERVITRIGETAQAEDPTAANSLEEYRQQSYRLVRRMLDLAEQHPQALALLHLQATAIDPRRMAQMMDTYALYIRALLQNGVDKQFLRGDLDVVVTAQLIVAMIFEGTRRVFPEKADRELAERWLQAGITMMFDGVGR